MKFVPLSEVQNEQQGAEGGFSFVPLAAEPTPAEPTDEGVQLAAPSEYDLTGAPRAPRRPIVHEFHPLEEAQKGVVGAATVGLPMMGEALKLSGGAAALDDSYQQLQLLDKIDKGEITSARELRAQPGFNPRVGMYFSSPNARDRLRQSILADTTKN